MKRITSTILIFTVILINICLPIKATSATSERDYKLEFDSIVEYFDSRIESTIEIGEVPGAALAIVKDGKIFTKGYGYSDLEKKSEQMKIQVSK